MFNIFCVFLKLWFLFHWVSQKCCNIYVWVILQGRGIYMAEAVQAIGGKYSDWWYYNSWWPGRLSQLNTLTWEALVMIWRMPSTLSMTSLPPPLWPWVVSPGRVLSMNLLFKLGANKWLILNLIAWIRTLWAFNCA